MHNFLRYTGKQDTSGWPLEEAAQTTNLQSYLWEGLDGTKIISHWMPLGYRAGLNLDKLGETYRELKRLSFTNSITNALRKWATMPQPQTSQKVKEWNENHLSQIKTSTPSEFFEDLEGKNEKSSCKKGRDVLR